ncbi:outer membrane usher protein [Citrobacter sp. Marseille-Q6884]|uniref:outer membrane usher protein n=1 Tax=Citrobacter sp. Marseille-Q6884 TaxID=2956786 RepID=UPI0021B2DF06|nr:outer membrane usher protein [Citrobacter sp. Marseille-Q6884]
MLTGKSPTCRHLYLHCIIAMIGSLSPVQALFATESVEFDSTFLVGEHASHLDLSRYKQGNPTPVGQYKTTIYINNKLVTNLIIDFVDVNKHSAAPCLTVKTLSQLNLKIPENVDNEAYLLTKKDDNREAEQNCLNIETLYPQSAMTYSSGDQRLDMSIPQIWLVKQYDNYVDPALWDEGINAGMLSYNANAYHTESGSTSNDSLYAGLNAGLNLLGWHFRARGNMNWNNDQGATQIEYQDRYVQHDIPMLHSQLRLGESNTTGETFDSVNLRGVRFYSDDRMLPPMLTGYAPVVRGMANSNAKVTITQDGYKIYESTVAPGPFAIDDLSPSGYGSDLVVTVTEADGSTHTFSVPFSSVVQLLRPGTSRWDLSAGEINQDTYRNKPKIVQGTYYRGLNNMFTGYTGLQVTDNHYLAGLFGVGMNTEAGAFSFDITHSQAKIPDDKTYAGESYRLSYSKLLNETDTSINIAAYRYSTQNYLGLNDALTLITNVKENKINNDGERYSMDNYSRTKNQVTLSVSQPLKFKQENYGSLYMNLSWRDYWESDYTQRDYAVGYSNSAWWGSYSINLQRSYDENNNSDDSLYLSVSIPLNLWSNDQHPQSGFNTINASYGSDLKGGSTLNASTSGNSADNKINYNVNTAYSSGQGAETESIGVFSSYESHYGTWSASASQSSDNTRQLSLNTDGSFVLHSGGLTFTNDTINDTDTVVLVKAPGAKGARLNASASTVDRWGYAVSNTLSPYRENNITLDISTMENDVELLSTSGTSVPHYGAITLVNFETNEERSAILTVKSQGDISIPLGADVYDMRNHMIGNFGQGGQAYIRGFENNGTLKVSWGSQPNQSCLIHYQLPDNPTMLNKTLYLDNLICAPIK